MLVHNHIKLHGLLYRWYYYKGQTLEGKEPVITISF